MQLDSAKHEGDPHQAERPACLRPVRSHPPVVFPLHPHRHRHRGENGLQTPLTTEPQRRAPPAADGRAESGPEPAVHAEFVPQRGGTGRKAQTAPEVRLQHGPAADTVRVDGALPARVQR